MRNKAVHEDNPRGAGGGRCLSLLISARRWFGCMTWVGMIWAFAGAGILASKEPEPLPTVEEILKRVAEKKEETPDSTVHLKYFREVFSEELNGDGKVLQSKLDRFAVESKAGVLTSERVGADGRPLEGEGDARALEKTPKSAPMKRGEFRFDDQLLERFRYSLVGEEMVGDRPAYLLEFTPNLDYASDSVQDRVMKQVKGRIWVDQEDYELARLDLNLAEKVSVGFGLLGAVNDLKFTLDRIRVGERIWLTQQSEGRVAYRELFRSKTVRWKEEIEDLRVVTGEDLKPLEE